MSNLPLNELKPVAKRRRIKGYKSMSKEKLLSVLSESELGGSEKNFDGENIREKILMS